MTVQLIDRPVSVAIYILLCLIWGSTWMAIRIGLQGAPPLYAAAFRFVIATAILWTIVAVRGYPVPRNLWQLLRLSHPGVYMYCGSYALVYFAEQYITSALTSVLFASFPLFVAMLSLKMLKAERLAWRGWLGLAVGLTGIVLISYDSLQTSETLFWGTLLAIAASIAAAFGMLLHKRSFGGENVVVSVAVQMTAGTVLLMALAPMFEHLSDFSLNQATVLPVLYLSLFGTVVTFIGYYWLLSHMRAVVVSLIAFITPIVAIFIGVTFLSESLAPLTIVGTGVILIAVLLVVRDRRT